MDTQLQKRIEEYLAERKLTDGDGWPKVTSEELNQLLDIIWTLTELKYEKDCDGDSVINKVWIENLSESRIPYFTAVPHENGKEKLRALIQNVKVSSEMLEEYFKIEDYNKSAGLK